MGNSVHDRLAAALSERDQLRAELERVKAACDNLRTEKDAEVARNYGLMKEAEEFVKERDLLFEIGQSHQHDAQEARAELAACRAERDAAQALLKEWDDDIGHVQDQLTAARNSEAALRAALEYVAHPYLRNPDVNDDHTDRMRAAQDALSAPPAPDILGALKRARDVFRQMAESYEPAKHNVEEECCDICDAVDLLPGLERVLREVGA